ncbi:MAG: UvrD-helicase domain-containing protein [Firmicutes bacterium]|nr:UvrD-helicase domain-containing protein [Bacillota bacterium]
MFEQSEINKLATVKETIISQVGELGEELTKKRTEVLDARKEMWREARMVIRDFDDVADLYLFAEEVSTHQRQYSETSKQLLKLKKMLNEPYFARIDFTEKGYSNTEEIYIGRYSLFDESTQTYHVYDWRAPISSLYYDYGVGSAHFVVPGTGATIEGEIALKRQYQIEKGELLYLFDNDLAIDDEILRRELSKSADASIKIIINTIQTEQNKAIRATAHNVLVHGPAGSGKTSVGLHRLAYLLYRDRNSLTSAKVRIFSPSPIFASYIAGIIPELGEEDVQNLDFPELIKGLAKDRRPFHGLYQQIDYMVAHPQNDARNMWLTHKYTPAFLDELESYVANYTPSFEDVMFNNDKLCSSKRLEELYEDRTASSTLKSKTDRVMSYVERTYADYFQVKHREITELFNSIHDENFSDHEIRVKFDEEKNTVIRDLRNRLRPTSSRLYGRFLKSYAYKTGLPHNLARQAIEMEKIYYEDALIMFYIDILTGQVAQDKTVRHILLDEAQDLSHVHHRILNKLYVSSNFTILADANQALYKGINLDSIDELKALYPTAQDIPLLKSYRSTYEINAFAAQFLQTPNHNASYTRHGDRPQVIEATNPVSAVLEILQQLPDSYNTVGILLPTAGEAVKFHGQLNKAYPKSSRKLQLIADENNEFAPGVMVMAVPFAKGLEFDVVICPGYGSPGFEGELGSRLMYLICTRALHRLYLIKA